MIARRTDWLASLTVALDEVADRPFGWGQWNCCHFVDHAVFAMTGQHPLGDYAGTFEDEASAMAVLRERDGSLRAACKRIFGGTVVSAFAKRGDVVLLRGGAAIGICVGATAAFVSDDGVGLVYRPITDCAYAFPLDWAEPVYEDEAV